jgi:hypothetical protein
MWIRIRAVIIEDEPLAAQYLAAMLDDTCQVEVIGSAIVTPVGRSVDYMSLMLFYMANSFHLARTPKLSLAHLKRPKSEFFNRFFSSDL